MTKQTQKALDLIEEVFNELGRDPLRGKPGIAYTRNALSNIYRLLGKGHISVPQAISEVKHLPYSARNPYSMGVILQLRNSLMHTQQPGCVDDHKDLQGEYIDAAEFEEMWKDYTDSLGNHTPQQDNIMHSKVDKVLDEPIDVTTKPKTIVEQMENYRKDCPEGGKCEPGELLIFGMEFCKKCVRSMD